MSDFKAVIFDSDGTLFNTFELIVSAYRHVAETHGQPIPDPVEVRQQLGRSLPDIMRHFFPGQDLDSLLHTNSVFFAANVMKSKAFEGVEALLADLQRQDIRLGLLTSGGSKVHEVLAHHGFAKYFSSVVHHERITDPKPAAEGFLLAAKECDVKPDEAVMVGDTVIDVQTGLNAGAYATIAVSHGFDDLSELEQSGADYVVPDMAGVSDILTRLHEA